MAELNTLCLSLKSGTVKILAEISFDGMDDVIQALSEFNLFDEQTQTKLLEAGAENLRALIVEEGGRSGQDVGRMLKKVSRPKKAKTDKQGNYYMTISPNGKNSRGERNATVLFVLNYGRTEPYGKIQGSYFWTRAVQRSQRQVIPIYEKIINDELTERGLV